MSVFVVRPKDKSADKDAFQIFISATSLLSLRLKPGDICNLRLATDEGGHQKLLRSAVVWNPASGAIKDTVIQTSKILQETYGFKLGDSVVVTRSTETLQDAANVTLLQEPGQSFDDKSKWLWEQNASLLLPVQHSIIVPGQKVTLTVGRQTHNFEICDLGATIARTTENTVFSIVAPSQNQTSKNGIKLDFSGIGGLETQIEQLEEIANELVSGGALDYWRLYGITQGILLYGPKGVGKSKFQAAVAQQGWDMVTRWKVGDKLPKLRGSHLLLMDLVNLPTGAVSELLRYFESIRGLPTLVIGEARHPNEIPKQLRGRSKFALEMEIPIPDVAQRYKVLHAMRLDSTEPGDIVLKEMASKTHGFVAEDLIQLLDKMWKSAIARQNSERYHLNGVDKPSITSPPTNGQLKASPVLQLKDLDYALTRVRPSALQEIFLEKPNVHWTDIGGQHEIKRQLKNAVERPLKHAERMRKVGVKPKKGVLLYGPPGCSKTLLVKALATEAELNFLAVKGAELVSMYVGESERATREIFLKARAASPSIIFFDEIDAIASRAKSGSDLNVLTTLLNEMDGFEELKNVMVVAATNKPQSIDPALMRPGRFDNVVYIGPPDFETRREILQNRFTQAEVEEDVKLNIDEYARLMEGFSGAEVVGICQTAGEFALDADRDFLIAQDLKEAIKKTPKSITASVLLEYEMWNSARMV